MSLTIGIISKKDHATSHANALKRAGHRVKMMGGSPTWPFPSSLDVLVCRPASCAHVGFSRAMRARRELEIPVIVANGVNDIVDTVKGIKTEKDAHAMGLFGVTDRPMSSVLPPIDSYGGRLNSEFATFSLADMLGIYGGYLHEEDHRSTVEFLASRAKKANVGEVLARWGKAIGNLGGSTLRRWCSESCDKGASLGDGEWVNLYFYRSQGGARRTALWVTEPEALTRLLQRDPTLHRTKDLAMAFGENQKRASNEARRARDRERAKEAKEAKEEVAVQPAEPTAPELPPAEPVVVEAPVSEPVVAPPKESSGEGWGAGVQAALALLVAEMKAARVLSLTVTQSGSVSFEREVVVVTRETGTLTIEADA